MCMIAHRPASAEHRGSNIPNTVIDTAIGRHPDGFGIAWREAGALRHEKFGPAESTEFRDALKKLDKDSTIEYTAHWRFATSGKPCRDLSHPFIYTDPIEGDVAVFHNGVIDIATGGSHESDTSVFVRDVMLRELVTVREDTPLSDAGLLLWNNKLGCLPVVDDDKKLVGIVTEADFVKLALRLLETRD